MAPDYQVTLSRPYRVGAHEVTVGQFRAFVRATGYKTDAETSGLGGLVRVNGTNDRKPEYTWAHPSVAPGDDHPVGQLSWNDAVAFCRWLSKEEGRVYRLPTEAEWEWACRAGSLAAYHFGDDPAALPDHAWFADNSGDRTHPVGLRKPNAWGLFDTHGNVTEYCSDWVADSPPTGRATDPPGPAKGSFRRLRGGAYIATADGVAAARAKGWYSPHGSMFHFGFRVVCEDVGPWPKPAAIDPRPAVAPAPRPVR
jgi:formylglycine-generating enzyme required for sulfatase activity